MCINGDYEDYFMRVGALKSICTS